MRGKIISYLLIMALILGGLPVETASAEDSGDSLDYIYVEDNYIINFSEPMHEPHYSNGYCFSDFSFYYKDYSFYMIGTVTNVSDVARDVTLPDVTFYAYTGEVIGVMGGIIGDLDPGKSAIFNASATTDMFVYAYDYTVSFSAGEMLKPDEEVVIKTGIICTKNEIKEHDTVTLVCEESDEGVRYQWFYSLNRDGGGILISGATDRRYTISDVSLEQYGYYYYCQLRKNGKLDYTDRLELIIKPSGTQKPTASPTPTKSPVPTVSPVPSVSSTPTKSPVPSASPASTKSPVPTASPTSKPSPGTTVKPTSEPDTTPIADSSLEPGSSVMPERTASPINTPASTASPMPQTSSKPTIGPSMLPVATVSPFPTPGYSPQASMAPGTSQEPFLPGEYQIAAKVTNIKVSQTADLKVKLTWKRNEANNIAILRAVKKGGPYKVLKRLSGDSTAYTDKTVKRGKTYYYKVVAYNENLSMQLQQKDISIKKITIGYLIRPVIKVTKGTSNGQKYVQIYLKKYEGEYADIYMKADAGYQKLKVKKRTIRAYRRRYRLRYIKGGVSLSFRIRTYRMVNGKKHRSAYSKAVRIRI